MSRRALRLAAAATGAAAFVAPFVVLHAVPRPVASLPAGQVVIVPPGSHLVLQQGSGGGAGASVSNGSAPPVATTGGSAP